MSALNSLAHAEIIDVHGILDSESGERLEQNALLYIQNGTRELVLNCAAVPSITAAGLRSILTIARAVQQGGGQFGVCNLAPQVMEMFRACGYQRFIPVSGNQGEAVAKMAA